jgi:hypothetical protein
VFGVSLWVVNKIFDYYGGVVISRWCVVGGVSHDSIDMFTIRNRYRLIGCFGSFSVIGGC